MVMLGTPGAAHAAGFGWMSGCWEEAKPDGAWTEECWTSERGGMLIGSGRAGDAERVKSFEHMRIDRGTDGTPTFWGSPGGATPVPFRQVSRGSAEAVFENPAHDYPVRVHYRREGELLVATIAGKDGKNPMTWRYRRK
jgi:hypothetical protein